MSLDDNHQFDRRSSDANVASLSLRVGSLEGRVTVLEQGLNSNTLELRANTVLTQQVHTNTEAIVEAVKWMATTKRFMYSTGKWVGAVGGGFIAVAGVAKLFGWL